MSKAKFGRGLRYGGLIEALCAARSAMQSAAKYRDLLSSDDAEELKRSVEVLYGMEQRVWDRIHKFGDKP
jgi:hypothetical protein